MEKFFTVEVSLNFFDREIEIRFFFIVKDIKSMQDIDFIILLSYYHQSECLENKYRDNLACCIIQSIFQEIFSTE